MQRGLQGQLCLPAGTLLGAPELGILATVGATQVHVTPRPTVAVLSSGDEVVEPSCERLGPWQVRDSNRSMLVAAAEEAGARVLDLGIAKDQARRAAVVCTNALLRDLVNYAWFWTI